VDTLSHQSLPSFLHGLQNIEVMLLEQNSNLDYTYDYCINTMKSNYSSCETNEHFN